MSQPPSGASKVQTWASLRAWGWGLPKRSLILSKDSPSRAWAGVAATARSSAVARRQRTEDGSWQAGLWDDCYPLLGLAKGCFDPPITEGPNLTRGDSSTPPGIFPG